MRLWHFLSFDSDWLWVFWHDDGARVFVRDNVAGAVKKT